MEYTLDWEGFSDGVSSFNSRTVTQIFSQIPADELYPLSPYEAHQGHKNWWTMEITEDILIYEDTIISVTYFHLLFFNENRTNGDIYIFIDGKKVLEMSGTPSETYSSTANLKSNIQFGVV